MKKFLFLLFLSVFNLNLKPEEAALMPAEDVRDGERKEAVEKKQKHSSAFTSALLSNLDPNCSEAKLKEVEGRKLFEVESLIKKKLIEDNDAFRNMWFGISKNGYVYSFGLSPNGKFIVTGEADKYEVYTGLLKNDFFIKICRINGDLIRKINIGKKLVRKELLISNDSKYIAFIVKKQLSETINILDANGNFIKEVKLLTAAGPWNITTSNNFIILFFIDKVQIYNFDGNWIKNIYFDRMDQLMSLAISSDNNFIAAGYATGKIELLDFKTGNIIRTIKDKGRFIKAIAISSKNKSIIAADPFFGMKIWDFDGNLKFFDGDPKFYLQKEVYKGDRHLSMCDDDLSVCDDDNFIFIDKDLNNIDTVKLFDTDGKLINIVSRINPKNLRLSSDNKIIVHNLITLVTYTIIRS